MKNGNPPDIESSPSDQPRPEGTTVLPTDTEAMGQPSARNDGPRDRGEWVCLEEDATACKQGPSSQASPESTARPRDAIAPLIASPHGSRRASPNPACAIPQSIDRPEREPGDIVRIRINAAVRPILKAYARSRGILSRDLEDAIDGPTTITHPAVKRELGGALNSGAVRIAIADNVDQALVPLKVRASLAGMLAQNAAAPPSSAVKQAYPDWNKPLVPRGQQHQVWHVEDAAQWLLDFPPDGQLLHPMNVWDDATAAEWLNDRESILPATHDHIEENTVVSIDRLNPWKPSLEVLHTLDDLEHEELAYRVFVERLRREVMPAHASQRKTEIQNAITLVTVGYQTLKEARRSVRGTDLARFERLDILFGEDAEWMYDLYNRILATYAWPVGFSSLELISEFVEAEDPS